MKIIKLLKTIICIAIIGGFVACDTEPEALEIQSVKELKAPNKGDEYYANLRAWKATRPEFGFGWFAGFADKASSQGSMYNIPDSMGIISIWGGFHPTTNPLQAKEMYYHQKICGTKVIKTYLIESSWHWAADDPRPELQFMQEEWGWDDGELRPTDRRVAVTPAQEQAIRAFARSVAEEAISLGYDGVDMDHEPNNGYGIKPYILGGYWNRNLIFFDELSKYFGPKSGTGRILALDGEYWAYIPEEIGPMLDYVIAQAYNCSAEGPVGTSNSLDFRMNRVYTTFPNMSQEKLASMFIVTENFESYAQNGGNTGFRTRNNQVAGYPSSIGMAKWQPLANGVEVRKGGAGTYHMEYEFNFYKDYKWLREMINIMATHSND